MAALSWAKSEQIHVELCKHGIKPANSPLERDYDRHTYMGQPAAALKEYETALKQTPNRFRAFWGAPRAADSAGERQKASEYFGKLVDLAKSADVERPEVREAKQFLARK